MKRGSAGMIDWFVRLQNVWFVINIVSIDWVVVPLY